MSSRADPLGNFPTDNTAQHRATPHTTPHNTRVDEGFRWTPTSAPQVQYVSSAAVSWTRSMSRTLFQCSKNLNSSKRAATPISKWSRSDLDREHVSGTQLAVESQSRLFHNMAAPPRVPFPPLPSLITPPIPIASPSHVSPREHARTLNARTHRHARAHARTFFRRGPGRTVASTVLGPGPRSILVREAVLVQQHALS